MFDDDYSSCFDDSGSAFDDTFDTFDYSIECHMDDHFDTCSSFHHTCINPANGLPMAGDGCAGVDVMGNPYGTDFSDIDGVGDL